jgi:hypothetical protein
VRKRAQIDSFNEMPKSKRPPEDMIWWGTADDIDKWIEKVYDRNEDPKYDIIMEIDEDEIE